MTDVADLINKQIKRKFIDNMFTALPAEILKVDDYSVLQTVDVKPLINKIYEDGVTEKLPVLYKVPVMMMGGGGALISVPLAVGDTVLLVFSMRDIDRWKSQDGTNTTPDTNRQHSLNDAIAIPGLYTNSSNLSPDPNDVVIKFAESEIRMTAEGDINIAPAASINITTADATITASGDVNIDAAGEVNLGSGASEKVILGDTFLAFFNLHVHPTAAVGVPSVPTVPMTVSQLSLDVKVK